MTSSNQKRVISTTKTVAVTGAEEGSGRSVNVRYLDEADPIQLLTIYEGNQKPQDCYIDLDLQSGDMDAGFCGDNMTPMSVWNGRTRRWRIPALRTTVANRILREITPLAEIVLSGSEVVWDGNNNVGRLSEDAKAASEQIEGILDDLDDQDEIAFMSAYDWFTGEKSETDELLANIKARGIDAVVDEQQGSGSGEGDYHIDDLSEYLENLLNDENIFSLSAT